MKHKLQRNGNPTPAACYDVAAALENALKKYPDMELNMVEPIVQADHHPCGTIHCHAGAYLIGAQELEKGKSYDFKQGAELMAHNLGFTSKDALSLWADKNPKIWGSIFGRGMFSYSRAFNRAWNISQIAEWWRNVGIRIEADNLLN